jgi:hypothetical protein
VLSSEYFNVVVRGKIGEGSRHWCWDELVSNMYFATDNGEFAQLSKFLQLHGMNYKIFNIFNLY